jgi:hypothetical protein
MTQTIGLGKCDYQRFSLQIAQLEDTMRKKTCIATVSITSVGLKRKFIRIITLQSLTIAILRLLIMTDHYFKLLNRFTVNI